MTLEQKVAAWTVDTLVGMRLSVEHNHANLQSAVLTLIQSVRDETRWLAFDVGCIECGEESAVIGLFATKELAEAACEVARDEQAKNWHGQHSFEVFDLRGKPL